MLKHLLQPHGWAVIIMDVIEVAALGVIDQGANQAFFIAGAAKGDQASTVSKVSANSIRSTETGPRGRIR
jgi:hypothetical protein